MSALTVALSGLLSHLTPQAQRIELGISLPSFSPRALARFGRISSEGTIVTPFVECAFRDLRQQHVPGYPKGSAQSNALGV